jgi:hypothetical protein
VPENAAPASPAAHRPENAYRHGSGSAIGRTILRSAVGVTSLPDGMAVEIEAVFELVG